MMKNKYISFLFLSLLVVMLSACVGPPKDDRCIPSDGSKTTGAKSANGQNTNSPAAGGSRAQEIDDALRNGHLITKVVNNIKNRLIGTDGTYSSSQGIFEGFINSPEYQTAIGGAFSLFVIIYGMSVAVGMVQVSLGDAAIRVAKIGFISVVATNWDMFYQTIGGFFIVATDQLIGYFMDNFSSLYGVANPGATAPTGSASGSSPVDGVFVGYDDLIARIFSFQMFAFISALLHAGVYSPVYGFLLVMAMLWVMQSIMKVVQVYVFSLFAKALLFAIAPIFLAFLLFERTKEMFNAWINQLVSFSLQPILITAYIGLFSRLLTPFFDEFAQYKMCWNRIDNSTDKWAWTFVNKASGSNNPVDFGSTTAPPIQLQTVFLFMFFAWLYKNALQMTDQITVSIANSVAGNLSSIQGLEAIRNGIGGAGTAPSNILNRISKNI